MPVDSSGLLKVQIDFQRVQIVSAFSAFQTFTFIAEIQHDFLYLFNILFTYILYPQPFCIIQTIIELDLLHLYKPY